MKKFLIVFFVAMLAISFTIPVLAADMPVQASAQKSIAKSPYPAGPIQKAERGFGNFFLGWSEIPKRIVDKTNEYNNPIKGLLVGFFQGSCKAFARTTSGAFDMATFPIASYDKPAILPDMPAAK